MKHDPNLDCHITGLLTNTQTGSVVPNARLQILQVTVGGVLVSEGEESVHSDEHGNLNFYVRRGSQACFFAEVEGLNSSSTTHIGAWFEIPNQASVDFNDLEAVTESSGGGSPGGTTGQLQFNDDGELGGAAGVEYQAEASPNIQITAQDDAHAALHVQPASDNYTEPPFLVQGNPSGAIFYFDPNGNTHLGFEFAVEGNSTYRSPAIAAIGNQGENWTHASVGVVDNEGHFSFMSALGGPWVFDPRPDLRFAERVFLFYTAVANGMRFVSANAGGKISFYAGASNDANERLAILPSGQIQIGVTGSPVIFAGAGSPQSVVTAPKGSLYLRSDGGAGTCLYVKESDSGNTGWVAK